MLCASLAGFVVKTTSKIRHRASALQSGFCRRRHRRPKAVCGSDGRRYPSHCELHRTACVTGRKLRPLPATACLAYDARLKTPTAEMETSTELTDQNNCNSHQVSVLLKQLRFDLMKRQCQDAGKLLKGCLDYSARSKGDAELIMDRIFARLDTNSNGRVTKFELAKKFAKPDPCFNLISRDNGSRQPPEPVPCHRAGLTLTCPLGLLGPFESITWTRRSIEIQSISNRSQDEGQVSITGMARQMDSGVYKCCSSLCETRALLCGSGCS
uniref:EF-hand domain-containing protein n=1 Tax=Macrostomum lignano TaxID=282301 RepID=A0A1I8F7Y3_9PLAT